MKKPEKQQLWLAISFLACVILALCNTNGLEGTEFSGGWLTGPLLSMTDIGTVLFLIALIVTFLYPRVAGVIGLASSLLCLPLYLYFIAPATFNQIFGLGHEFKIRPTGGIHWDGWALAGVLTLAATAYFCLLGFAKSGRARPPARG